MLRKRALVVFIIFFTMLSGLCIRLFYFQICVGQSLSKAASAQRTTNFDIEKPRGDIVDRNCIPFTNRSGKYSIVLKPLYLRSNEDEVGRVCYILGVDYNKIRAEIETKRGPILLETDEKRKNQVMDLGVMGISSINSLKRYDSNSIAKHVLGYLNRIDRTGETGIEKFYEDVLKYDSESAVGVVTDARNNLVEGLGYRMIRTEDNDKKLNVKLTLDYHIQKTVENVMAEHGITGAVVIEDVYNGDIVAMASKPDYDQNEVGDYLQSPMNELYNRAVASYNLGSIFKIIDVAAAFETEQTVDEEFFCPGFIKIGNKEFKCSSYEKGGHGGISLTRAFAESCNPYFISMGIKIGYKNIISMAKKFGIDSITGINKQGVYEFPGNLPDINRYYSKGDIANISIGQGEVMATPLQIADMVATIANGGIKNRVNIVDSVVDGNGSKVRNVRINAGERVISKNSADSIKQLMEEVTSSGTGTRAGLSQYGGAAGKTGSAETGRKGIVHAWFAGYFPQRTPKYSIAVFVENGQNGGKVAAPIFEEIAEEIMKKGL